MFVGAELLRFQQTAGFTFGIAKSQPVRRALSLYVARRGLSARMTAALTAIRVAPASSTRSRFSSLIPPMANQGSAVVSAARRT